MNSLYIRNRLFEPWSTSEVGGSAERHGGFQLPRHCSTSNAQPEHDQSSFRPVFKYRHSPVQATSLPRPDPKEKRAKKADTTPRAMADRELSSILKQLYDSLRSHDYSQSPSLLSRAKICLLNLNGLVPSPHTPRQLLLVARETLELGALVSIRLQDPDAFTRYFQQLQPFYSLPADVLPREGGNVSKVTGLYLLLQLSQGDYAGFHTTLEALETQAQQAEGQASQRGKTGTRIPAKGLEDDAFVQYPIRLEQALMEGSYDRVWGETKSERVPSEEFAIFSDVRLPRLPFCLLGEDGANMTHRFSLELSAARSHPAAKKHILHYQFPMPKTSSSSTAKAVLSNLPRAEAGL